MKYKEARQAGVKARTKGFFPTRSSRSALLDHMSSFLANACAVERLDTRPVIAVRRLNVDPTLTLVVLLVLWDGALMAWEKSVLFSMRMSNSIPGSWKRTLTIFVLWLVEVGLVLGPCP